MTYPRDVLYYALHIAGRVLAGYVAQLVTHSDCKHCTNTVTWLNMIQVSNVQSQLDNLIGKNYHLNRSARDAFRGYILAYASHSHKHIFDVQQLDLQAVGQCFGFAVPPKVNINFKHTGGDKGRQKKSVSKFTKSGHTFSADNPYGKRQKSDHRQFSK